MENTRVKLTVTITNYNQKDYIEDAVDSILKQELDYSYEILIGDDGSTDGSWELLQEKYGDNDNIKMYRMSRDDSIKEFSNWRHVRLICFLLKRSRGEYISILDGDDFYSSRDGFQRKIDFLELKENKDCIACTSATIFTGQKGEEPQEIPASLTYRKLTIKDVFFSKEKFYFHIATCVFRRSVLKHIDFKTPELLGADQAILYFILHYGKLYVMPEYDFTYRILSDSIWHKGNKAEHAIRSVISFNIARRKYDDFYFRRLWMDRNWILYVYRNKRSIPKQIDWEMWKGFIDKYHLDIAKYLMGDRNVSFKVKAEMKISVIALSILTFSPVQKCKYVAESMEFLFSRSVPAAEKKERVKATVRRVFPFFSSRQ